MKGWTLTIFAFWGRSQVSYCLLLVWRWWLGWASYLSEDEAGGRGAAIGPLQPAASGVRPSISLQTKQNIHFCSMWFCCTSHCVSSSHRRTEGRPPCCSLIITRVSVTRALTLSTPLLSLSRWPDYIKSVFWHFKTNLIHCYRTGTAKLHRCIFMTYFHKLPIYF